ncbi:tetratricopeptide repeat protein [Aureibaculum algae]|uniref:Tetratricopeptide repeat protein n=1 Tax=Aureibaculum algae TaxID=2584122 RepID=A0A5B7TXI3_9FLAO|nr:tetratricopeptide repeat protein [Aureibaculum algae]QCX40968.1 tetratricopeptide repeat protein [Aureibaculum algae]
MDSTYLPALLNRGIVYVHSERIEKALADFNKSIELNPTEPASYLNRAVAYRESDKNDLACLDLKKAKLLGISEKYNSDMTDKMIVELNCGK